MGSVIRLCYLRSTWTPGRRGVPCRTPTGGTVDQRPQALVCAAVRQHQRRYVAWHWLGSDTVCFYHITRPQGTKYSLAQTDWTLEKVGGNRCRWWPMLSARTWSTTTTDFVVEWWWIPSSTFLTVQSPCWLLQLVLCP